MDAQPGDARALAFAALQPLARLTSEALERVQETLDSERTMTSPLRRRWHPTQHASSRGISRFAHTVDEWGRALAGHPRVRRISRPVQEAQNLWLWLLDERYVLRIKHDLEDVVDPGTATLFSLEPQSAVPTVFLTWETAPGGELRRVAFATVDEPRWTITLRELLEADTPAPESVAGAPPQVGARSKLTAADEANTEHD
jgi:hypothetical protein